MSKITQRLPVLVTLFFLGASLGLLIFAILLHIPPFLEWLAKLTGNWPYIVGCIFIVLTASITAAIAPKHPANLLLLAAGLSLAGGIAILLSALETEFWKQAGELISVDALQLGTGLASLAFALFAVHHNARTRDHQ